MKKILVSILGMTLSLAAGQEEKEVYPWKAAAAKTVINPKESVWMAGYAARKSGSEGVLQDIHAKALAIEDAKGGRFVFVTLDLIGVPKPLRIEIEKSAEEKHQLAPGSLLLNASHTHCGPMIRLYRPPGAPEGTERAPYLNVPDEEQEMRVRQVREYNTMLVSAINGLVDKTLGNLEPVRLTWSKARCGFAMNRRTPTGTGGFKNFPNPDGPVDHDVPVLQVRSPDNKELKAVLFGYACHATTLSVMEINGDWPGFAQTYFESDHPETIALFLNGASGDQNPYPRRFPAYLERHGRSMAMAIEAALVTEAKPLAGPLKSAIAWPEIPYGTAPTREELEKRSQDPDRYESRYAEFLLDVLEHKGALPESYPIPVQVVRFGDTLTLAAIGGEVTIDYSLRLKRELAGKTGGSPVWFAGYSNDVMSYVPSRRVIEEGGYEGKSSFRYARSTIHPNTWDVSIEERLVGEVHRLLEELSD